MLKASLNPLEVVNPASPADVPPPLGLSRTLSSFTTTGLSFTFTIFLSLSVVSLPPLNVVPWSVLITLGIEEPEASAVCAIWDWLAIWFARLLILSSLFFISWSLEFTCCCNLSFSPCKLLICYFKILY